MHVHTPKQNMSVQVDNQRSYPQHGICVCLHLVEKVAIFILFELSTPSPPSIGLHPSMLAPCYWHNFFVLNLASCMFALIY